MSFLGVYGHLQSIRLAALKQFIFHSWSQCFILYTYPIDAVSIPNLSRLVINFSFLYIIML